MPKTRSTTGAWTAEALIAKEKAAFEHSKDLQQAVAYARGLGVRAKAAMKKAHEQGLHLNITWNMVHNVLSGRSKRANGIRMPWHILTTEESEQLVTWIKGSAINKDPAFDCHINQKIVEMLKARKVFNKLKKGSVKAGAILLTPAEKRLLEPHASVSRVFLQHFRAQYPEVQVKCENNIDATRAKKMNEHTIDHHFFGDAGLEASMIHH